MTNRAMPRKPCNFLPLAFYEGFLRTLCDDPRVVMMTYSQLDVPPHATFRNNYLDEWILWQQSLKEGRTDRSKIYVFLQQDVDQHPDRTVATLLLQQKYQARSTNLLFWRKIERHILAKEGKVVLSSDYTFNFRDLAVFESEGIEFGYHSNALERANFCPSVAEGIFADDVAQLRKYLRVACFSPHGGVRDVDGVSNPSFVPQQLHDLIWVQNRFGLRFNGYYSDGALNGRRDPNSRDLRDFVASMRPGMRYRILLHPQYFAEEITTSQRLLEATWYRDVVEAHYSGQDDYW